MIWLTRNRVINLGCSPWDAIRSFFDKKDYISEFEKKFAEYIGVKYSVATCSGRHALVLIIKALGLKPGDEIIIPAYTYFVVPQMANEFGLKVIFADINRDTANIDPAALKSKITKRTKAVIVTHLYGRPAQMDDILKAIKGRDIAVIEDTAQSVGAIYRSRKAGSFGTGFFSFDTAKEINTLGGGAVTTNDELMMRRISEEIKNLSKLSTIRLLSKIKIGYKEGFLTVPFVYTIIIWPMLISANILGIDLVGNYQKSKNVERMKPYQFTNLQAKMGLRQLSILDSRSERRVAKAKMLAHELGGAVDILKDDDKNYNIYSYFIILCNNKNELARKLLANGIDADTKMMQNCGKLFGKGDFKNAEWVEKRALKIPLYDWLGTKQIKQIAQLIKRYAK